MRRIISDQRIEPPEQVDGISLQKANDELLDRVPDSGSSLSDLYFVNDYYVVTLMQKKKRQSWRTKLLQARNQESCLEEEVPTIGEQLLLEKQPANYVVHYERLTFGGDGEGRTHNFVIYILSKKGIVTYHQEQIDAAARALKAEMKTSSRRRHRRK
ncbi:MAG: hypothetical protein HYZ63_00885 [Candidatus Andersenbacteria bacterium]|nr:hypothetical protein [Candidatus Andersenbacteria bacterium]